MLVTFGENYKVEAYEEHDNNGDDTGFTNIDLYKSVNQIGWNYRLTLQVPIKVEVIKDIDYLIKKMVEIDKGK